MKVQNQELAKWAKKCFSFTSHWWYLFHYKPD